MFRTPLPAYDTEYRIDHSCSLMTLGSCFSSNIGDRLIKDTFLCESSLGGTLYHPFALMSLFQNAINQSPPDKNKYIERDNAWLHHDFHSSLRAQSRELLENQLYALLENTQKLLKSVDYLIITWGTSWIYRHKENDSYVANCHKVPAKKFKRELVSAKSLIENTEKLIDLLKAVNPNLNIILTVSPVRHIRDGLIENNVSKSNLLIAAYHLNQKYEHLSYYPAYEIMMDDLRDYRFYEKDLIHPNEMAIDYIYEHFKKCFFNEQTVNLVNAWNKVRRMLDHRPFNENSAAHLNMLNKAKKEMITLSESMPLEKELKELEKRIDSIQSN